MRDLGRVALWGMAAACAVTVAALVGQTEIGRERTQLALLQVREILMPSGITPPRPLDAQEGRRLAENVRVLTADRERLVARIATLERNVEDMTGSIARVEKTAQTPPAPPVAEPPQTSPPESAPPAIQEAPQAAAAPSVAPAAPPSPPPFVGTPEPEDITATVAPLMAQTQPTPPAKPEFGLDLGGGANVEMLRALWNATLRRHPTLLEGLRPVVHLRERRAAPVELRLVAGPVANAAAAARLCAAIAAGGALCQPSVFEGQRLALR